ncbi:hypothetical protein AB0M02_12690 [Actinoplanes sp. NPDC051861]|uniref:hypothetical protein n=1 Tax=Actinoplanes sp. NPDC051861 TaxID=3155170 RepID=UPI003439A9E0
MAADPVPDWPNQDAPAARPDWRERLALATDLALIGVLVTVAALPVLTAPAAVTAGSAAVRHRYTDGGLPPARPLLRLYRRAILPGLPVLLVAAVLLADLVALSRGWVPGGPVLFFGTAAVAGWLGGFATLAVVAIGRDTSLSFRSAARWAWEQATTRPWTALAPAAAGVIAFFLALSVPATIPLVLGFQIFAAHVITDRLAPTPV